jgi:uncharacterized small protein (DUF1192 family)
MPARSKKDGGGLQNARRRRTTVTLPDGRRAERTQQMTNAQRAQGKCTASDGRRMKAALKSQMELRQVDAEPQVEIGEAIETLDLSRLDDSMLALLIDGCAAKQQETTSVKAADGYGRTIARLNPLFQKAPEYVDVEEPAPADPNDLLVARLAEDETYAYDQLKRRFASLRSELKRVEESADAWHAGRSAVTPTMPSQVTMEAIEAVTQFRVNASTLATAKLVRDAN